MFQINKMKQEFKIFLTAVMFYTRIPCPKYDFKDEYLNEATKYFPLIGWIVALAAAFTIYLSHFLLPISIAVILSFLATILITGSFHEDGLADVADGFGGGWNKLRILDIMKDSRIGAYGVVALIITFSLKITALIELFNFEFSFGIKAIFLGHVLSRLIAETMIYTHEYSRDDALSKIKPIAKKLSFSNLIISILITIPAFIIFDNWLITLIIIPAYLTKIFLARYFKKWIDGYTGDCLGATQQITEVIIYISLLILWKFI